MILFKMFLLMCVIYTFEIFGTAGVGYFDKSKPLDTRKSLMGFSYVWMCLIYFLSSGLFLFLFWLISSLAWFWIIPIVYIAGVIFMTLIETGWGWVLNKFLGFCPWSHYTKEQRGILFGYSRWDWSLMYGGFAVLFYYFIILFDYAVRWM